MAQHTHVDLKAIARKVAIEQGFAPDLPPAAQDELAAMTDTLPETAGGAIRDLRDLLWSSIDNDESRDLDQIEVADRRADGRFHVLVGVADVDSRVAKGSALDQHARANTTSLYTPAIVFAMLPEKLSTDLTSLDDGVDRLALVIDSVVSTDGDVVESTVYRALVKNHAQLAYEEVGHWLEHGGQLPPRIARHPGLDAQLRLQSEAARALKKRRHERGALDLETVEARAVTSKSGDVVDVKITEKNEARDLIEDFMVAANTSMARFLETHGVSSIRRVVKKPERWARIVTLAAQHDYTLPEEPSSTALMHFLDAQKKKDREHFADVSLAVVKLMGPGEYALEQAGVTHEGHFGLAVRDYTHSTAPNRRYADLVTQRMVKAVLAKALPPYSDEELAAIALTCTEHENAAAKVERTMRKVASALFLSAHIGETYEGIVTGASPKGTFVRLIHPPAEGRVVRGEEGVDVGDKIQVRLVATEPTKGFIDFARV
jgi:exoribonuclease-2